VNDYDALASRWKSLRAGGEIAVREVACVGAPRTLLCAERGDFTAPMIALSAGVHGDESAGPWALLALCEDGDLDDSFAYRIWPCMNPSGFQHGTRQSADGADVNRSFGRGGQTPEARAIVTANRDRKYPLSLDLHEDCDAAGFYCYEYGTGDIGRAVVDAVRSAGFPIQDLAQCDLGMTLECSALDDGVVRASPQAEIAVLGGLSYSLLVARHAAQRALTFETPAALAWDDRIAIHRIAVKAALAQLSKQQGHG
jgi:murein peptide amidase A